MSKINWEQKYKALKKILIESLDLAFRQGFEEGYRQAQREQQDMAAQQSMMAAQQSMMAAQQGMMGGQQGLDMSQLAGGSPDEMSQLKALMSQQGEGEEEVSPYQQLLSGPEPEEGKEAELAEQLGGARQQGIPEKINELQALLNKKEKMVAKNTRGSMFEFSRALNRKLDHTQKQGVIGQEKLVRNILDKWKREKKDTENYFDTVLKNGKIKLE